jgi:hypothetical protein
MSDYTLLPMRPSAENPDSVHFAGLDDPWPDFWSALDKQGVRVFYAPDVLDLPGYVGRHRS